MTDFVRPIIRFYSPTWIDFTNFINQVQLMLFAKRFLFFPPVESALFSIGRLSYGGYYYLKGEAKLPPSTPNASDVQFPRVKSRNKSNNGNPYAAANNYHCLGFPSRSKHSACRPLGLPAPIFRAPGLRPSGNPLMKQHQAAVCLSA